jgi:hypothetical protein
MLQLYKNKLFYIGTKLPKLTRTRSILDVFDVDISRKNVETIKNRVLATHFLEVEYLP